MAPVRRPVKKCPHGRQQQHCRDCGGASICEHGRQRHQCRDCGGSSFCEHGRRRAHCRECGGTSVCEHGRMRHRCRDCGGASICEHGRRRDRCRDCGGTSSTDESGTSVATAAARPSVSTHGCGSSAAARRSASMLGCGTSAATASGHPSAGMDGGGRTVATAPILCVKLRAVLGKISPSPERRACCDTCKRCTATIRAQSPRARNWRCARHSATRRSPLSTSTTCPSAAAGWSRRRPTPSRTLPCRLRGATSCWRLTRSSTRPTTQVRRAQGLRHGRQRGAWQRPQAAAAALQPGRLQDRRRDAADHQEGAPRTADPPAGRAVGARAGGAFHPPLSLLRPGRGEQRAALRGGALVRARARRVPLRMMLPQRQKGWHATEVHGK